MLPVVRKKNTKQIASVVSIFIFVVALAGILYPQAASAEGGLLQTAVEFLNDPVGMPFKILLYGVFELIGVFVSGAVGIFSYAIDTSVYGPDGLFNKSSVYNMWKFIRDFFNLFFILTILYTAFTIVFQIAGNYKKTLLSIVLAALFVNFSFPITRVMIDAANVPMYYFVQLIMESKNSDGTVASSVLGPALAASGLEGLLIPGSLGSSSVSQILMAIVFMFVFMVTLMVLAILFVIRMMALLVLVMFSSVGFAGSVIPGMKKYSDMWWDKLAQYALFGPAAMFMLYVATQFFSQIAKDDTLEKIKLAGAANATQSSTSFLASMGLYSITIIMLWIAIGLANSMSVMGASAVTGKGQQFLKWAGKKTTGYNSFKAFGSEIKKRSDAKFAATNIGTRLGQKFGLKMDELNAKRVGTRSETRGVRHDASAAEEGQKREIANAAKNYRIDDRTSASELQRLRGEAHKSGDMALLAAVVNQMAKKEDTASLILDNDKQAIDARYRNIGNVDNAARTENREALKKHRADLAYATAAERDAAFAKNEIKLDTQAQVSLVELKAAAIKNGKYTQQLLAEMKKTDPDKADAFIKAQAGVGESADVAMHDLEARYQAALAASKLPGGVPVADNLKRERAAAQQAYLYAMGDYHASITTDDQRKEVLKKVDHETLAKMADNPNKGVLAYNINLMAQVGGPGKTAAVLAKMAEEGKDIQASVNQLKATASSLSAVGQVEAKKVVDRMKADYRFDGIV